MVRPDQVSLGVLVNAVPRDAVDEAVAVCGVREKRSDGKLPAHVVAYLTLALCLFPDDDYAEVATKVTGSLDRWGCWNADWTVPTTSAITQARKRPHVTGVGWWHRRRRSPYDAVVGAASLALLPRS